MSSLHDCSGQPSLELTHTLTAPFVDQQVESSPLLGQRIGPYHIVSEIGRGGMGIVYRASRVDGAFTAEVAIKVVSRELSLGSMQERFRMERQIQASLQHPNITRLLDGGTTDEGLLYFVMEYIEGVPLTHYCDAKQLSISERLSLFCKICDAVVYAHQRLVVHRDLKPDNILVTDAGEPKLLDFGIAKLLEIAEEDGVAATQTVLRMGTPAYASPEQLRGEPVGLATDVYSLGVLLYELLTGRRPYYLQGFGWEEVARAVCEREATRPSLTLSVRLGKEQDLNRISRSRRTTVEALRKRLAGDLDNIVSLAIRSEPTRRYQSVDRFNEDVQRHLEGRPVMARGDSVTYRTGKLLQRHKLGTTVGLVFILLLIGTSAVAGWQASRLAARLGEDQQLASSFLVDIHEQIARLPGSTPVREALLARSLQYLKGLTRDGGKDREMQRSLALAYERFADLESGMGGTGLGRSGHALATYGTARQLREQLARERPSDVLAQYELASNYLIGSFITGRSSGIEQRTWFDKQAVAIAKQLNRMEPGQWEYQRLLAKAYTSTAYTLGLSEQWQDAWETYRKALAIQQQLAREKPSDVNAQRELATLYYRMAVMETQSGHYAEAIPLLKNALVIQDKLSEADPNDERLSSEAASSHHFLGIALGEVNLLEEALSHFQTAISKRERTLAADGRDTRTRSLLAGNYAEQASVLLKGGKTAAALTSIQRAIALQQKTLESDPHEIPARLSLANYEGRLARMYAASGTAVLAGENWRRARDLYNELDREGHVKASDVRADAEQVRAEAARSK